MAERRAEMRELPPGATFWNCSAVHGGFLSLYGFPRVRSVTPNISQVLWCTFQEHLHMDVNNIFGFITWPLAIHIWHHSAKTSATTSDVIYACFSWLCGSFVPYFRSSDVRVYFQLDLFRLDIITDRCNPPSARQESCHVIPE